MTRAYNTATTQQNTGGAVAGVTAGKNAVINGGMDIWQRGTSFTNPNNGYTADRWLGSQATAGTITRVATGDTTNLPNIQYALRYQRTSASTSTSQLNIIQNFESVNSIPLAGKTVTLSFYARKGANYSPTSSLLGVVLPTGTGTDQNYYTAGYTGSADTINSSATLTTTWQRFTYTATLPVTTTETAVYFYAAPTGTAGAADYYEITGIQLEVGSVATPFSRTTGTLATELAACQRYYQRRSDSGGGYSTLGLYGWNTSTTIALVSIDFSQQMRVTPTSIEYGNSPGIRKLGGTNYSISSMAIQSSNSGPFSLAIDVTHTAGTANDYVWLWAAGSSTAYIGWSAEL